MTDAKPKIAEDAVLKMRGIRKAFPGVVALDEVDFQLHRGEVHALLGENGAGKSTLIKILTGAYIRDAGEILLDNESVALNGPADSQAMGISCVYQEFDLVPHLSVAQNIFLGKEPERFWGVIDGRELRARARKLLQDLGIDLNPDFPVRTLSVAQQQMVEVAKAIAVQARILIMDEPTSALTHGEARELFAAIRRLRNRGTGIIYITHKLEELFEIADSYTVLRDGRLVGSGRVSDVSVRELIRLMVDRDIQDHFPRAAPSPGEELLRVEKFSRQNHFEDVTFTLRRGEILGLAGLLGAGRTALARSLFGADPFDSGRILVRGGQVAIRSPGAAIRRGMGFLTEDRKGQGLILILSVLSNISLPSLTRLSRLGVVDGAAEKSMAERFIRELRIKTPGSGQKALYLSGGHQQKVVLSKWLAREAEILIFDEPTRGIDVASKVEIYQFMNRLTEQGAGILMISSEMPEVLGMSDRVVVMHQGRIRAELNAKETSQEAILRAALGELP
ncbi:MAG TPA: sugar ABC transporter ATP-binding protein [Acidobacteriota bacterium]|nr:sugar ABC transporter ATP-binding protein [Acidobacteriota bacterium]